MACVFLAGIACSMDAEAFPAIVSIGNGPDSPSGDYINAGSLANTLAFTSVTIAADQVVRVVDPSDVSSSVFGPTLFDVFLQAPLRVEVLGDLTMGAGSVTFSAPEVQLSGTLREAGGIELDGSRLAAPTTTAYVVGAGGSVQQASLLASENPSLPTVITVDGASDPNLVNVWSHVRLELLSGFVENLTLLAAGSRVDWRGGQVGETGLFGFGGTIRIYGSQFEIGPYTVCSGIPPSGWTSAPASLTNVGACLRGQLETGEPFLVIANFGGTLELVPSAPPAAVPGPGWWIAPPLLLLARASLRSARAGAGRDDRASGAPA